MADVSADATLQLTLDAQDNAGSAIEGVTNALEGVRNVAGAIGLASAGAYIEAAHHLQEYGLQVERLSFVTGESTQQTSRLIGAFRDQGISAEASQGILQRLQMRLGAMAQQQAAATAAHHESRTALDILHVSLNNADGSLRSMTDILPQIIQGLHDMTDAHERARIATQLFGRNYAQLAPLVEGGADAFKQAMMAADQYGLVLNPETVAAAHEAEQAHEQLGMAIDGVTYQMGVQSMPHITRFNQMLAHTIEWLRTANPAATNAALGFAGFMAVFGSLAGGAGATLSVLSNLTNAFPVLGGILDHTGGVVLRFLIPFGLLAAAGFAVYWAYNNVAVVHQLLHPLVATLQGAISAGVSAWNQTHSAVSVLHAVLLAFSVPLQLTNLITTDLSLVVLGMGRAFNFLTSPLRESHSAVNALHPPSWALHAAFTALHQATGFVYEQFLRFFRLSGELWREILFGGGIISSLQLLFFNLGVTTQVQQTIVGAFRTVILDMAEGFNRIVAGVTGYTRAISEGFTPLQAFSIGLYDLGIKADIVRVVMSVVTPTVNFLNDAWIRLRDTTLGIIAVVRLVYETAFPPLAAAVLSLMGSFGLLNSTFNTGVANAKLVVGGLVELDSKLDATGGHTATFTGNVQATHRATEVFFLMIGQGLAFLAVTLPAYVTVYVANFRVFAATVDETFKQVNAIIKISMAVLHGDIGTALALTQAEWDRHGAAVKQIDADKNAAVIAQDRISNGTVAQEAALMAGQVQITLENAAAGNLARNHQTTYETIEDARNRREGAVGHARAMAAETVAAGNSANLFGAGVSVAQGFADGIYARKNAAIQAAREMAGEVEYATRNTIQATSPSQVFMRLGGYVPEGFALGITGGKGGAVDAVTSMVQGVNAAASGGLVRNLTVSPTASNVATATAAGVGGMDPELLRRLLAALSARPGGTGDIVLRLDSRELARVVFDQGSERWKLLGGTLGSGA